jgi:hypothetical protein
MAEGAEIIGRKPARAAQRFRAFFLVCHGDTCSRPCLGLLTGDRCGASPARIDLVIFAKTRPGPAGRGSGNHEICRQGFPEPLRQFSLAVRLDQKDRPRAGATLLGQQLQRVAGTIDDGQARPDLTRQFRS